MNGSLKLALCLAGLLTLAGTHYAAYHVGVEAGKADGMKVDSTRKDVALGAVVGAVARNEQTQQENGAKARKVSDALQKEITSVLDYRPAVASVRLPALALPGCGGAAAAPEAASASGPDGAAAGTVVFPEEVQRAFDEFTAGAGQLAKEADKATAVARAQQEFARNNGFYGDAKEESK